MWGGDGPHPRPLSWWERGEGRVLPPPPSFPLTSVIPAKAGIHAPLAPRDGFYIDGQDGQDYWGWVRPSPQPLSHRERGYRPPAASSPQNPVYPVYPCWIQLPSPTGRGVGVRAVLRQAQDERGGGGRGGFWVKRAIAVWCGEGLGWFTFAATVG